MENEIVIKDGSSSLRFSPSSFERIFVKYETDGVDIETELHLYSDCDHYALISYFEDLSIHWKGWEGTKSWKSTADGFSFDAVHDSLAYINLKVSIGEDYSTRWKFVGEINLDLGALDQLASDVKILFPPEY